jgi:hypothetical protein
MAVSMYSNFFTRAIEKIIDWLFACLDRYMDRRSKPR